MIDLRCDACGHTAHAPESFRGRKFRCPRCRAKLRAPDAADAPEAAGAPDGAARVPPENASTRRRRAELETMLRALLRDRSVTISATAAGLEVRLRNARTGEARELAEWILGMPHVRDVRLLGGVGTAVLGIAVEGARHEADESFADGDAETKTFRRELLNEPGTPTFESEEAESRPELAAGRADEEPGTETYHSPPKPARMKPAPLDEDQLATLMRLLAEGQAHLDAGEPREALAPLERAVRIDRTWPEVVRALADAYARLGEHDKARKAYKHLSRLEPDDAHAFIDHAAMATACDKLDEALEALARAMRLAPDEARVYRYAAVVQERKGDREAARLLRARSEALRRPEVAGKAPRRDALEGYPLAPRVAALAAPVLERGDPEAYRRLLEQVLEDPCFGPLETLERVDRALEKGDQRLAAAELQRIAATWIASPRYHTLRAEVATRRGREAEAEQERRFASRCLETIVATGDGSRERPFLVAHASDEHDVLERAKPRGHPRGAEAPGEPLVAAGKLLVERRRSRFLDVVELAPDSLVAFDVTGPQTCLLRHGELEPRERDRADRGARGPAGTDGGWLLPVLGEIERLEDEALRTHARKLANLIDSYPVPREAKEAFLELVAAPQAPRFLDLRRQVLAGHFAALWTFDWASVEDRLRRERFKEALDLLEASVGLGLLSAPFHRLLSRARRGLGQGAIASLELDLAKRCTAWVELTGDGSEARPFVVSCEAEEAELLASRAVEGGEPHVRLRRDRAFRIYGLEDGSRLWFDVSDPFREVHLPGARGADRKTDTASDAAQRLLWVRSWTNARPGAAALESGERDPETVQLFAQGRRPQAARASRWTSAPHQPGELHSLLYDLEAERCDAVWTRRGRELCDAVAPYHLSLEIKRDFLRLCLAPPQKERYLTLRHKLLDGCFAQVHALEAKPFQELAHAKRFEDLAERARAQMGLGLLSVHPHRFLSLALRETGREFLARTEYLIAHLARTWIQLTGDGSAERPSFITCPRDALEVLEHMGFESERHEIVERGGRVLDVATAKNGRKVFFDITEAHRAAQGA